MTVLYSFLTTPIGDLLLSSDGEALISLSLPPHRPGAPSLPPPAGGRRDDRAFSAVAGQLAAYFTGELTEFDLPLRPQGTPFQQSVWAALRTIDYGQTASYGELAGWIGSPGAARAVGLANGRNPIAIIIPCHRVIGSNGTLTGFGGGLDLKRRLLEHEAAVRQRLAPHEPVAPTLF